MASVRGVLNCSSFRDGREQKQGGTEKPGKLSRVKKLAPYNVGALKIRIGFWGFLIISIV